MAVLDFKINENILKIDLKGDFIHFDEAQNLYATAKKKHITEISIKASDLKKWDSSLLLILYELHHIAKHRNISLKMDNLPDGLRRMLNLALMTEAPKEAPKHTKFDFLTKLGGWGLDVYKAFWHGWDFSITSFKSIWRFLNHKAVIRKVDFWFALEDCGPKAIAIVALISFMVGLILAFVGAIQLKIFGAQIYVASLVAIGMTRIMGAIMVGIIMAGRTGASFAATLGTMQVNEEIDALKTMGIPIADFLVLPRLMALVLVMPLLTMLADFMGMLGGGFVGIMLLDIPTSEYWKYSLEAWNLTNFWVGVFHGFVFGFIISLCGCYYGINSGRNADGVGVATTKAVVSAIIWMIVATGIITFVFERLGI